MFILIPLLCMVVGIAGLVVITYRKLPYLNKLTPESHETDGNLAYLYFPELEEFASPLKIKGYQQMSLRELEKLVRRFRMISLKIDHMSDRLIKKIRRQHTANHLEHIALTAQEEAQSAPEPVVDPMDELRDREQQTIIEIAKNPKEPKLYEELGDLYIAMHNIGEAKESYEAALALDPANQQVAGKYKQLLKVSESTIVPM